MPDGAGVTPSIHGGIWKGRTCRTDTNRTLQYPVQGLKEMKTIIGFYKENARMLRATFVEMGFTVHGGRNAPYIWVGFPGRDSWDVFAEILDKCDIVTTPGIGFGPAGHGFVRISAFGTRENVEEGIARFQKAYGQSLVVH